MLEMQQVVRQPAASFQVWSLPPVQRQSLPERLHLLVITIVLIGADTQKRSLAHEVHGRLPLQMSSSCLMILLSIDRISDERA